MKKVIVETSELKELLNSAKKYVSKDGIRPFYKNVKFECKKDSIRIVAINGYRLIYNECKTKESSKFDVVVPMFTIPKDAEKYTTLTLKNKVLIIDFGCYEISYKVAEEEFLKYENIIKEPEKNYKIVFNAKLLKEALEAFKDEKVELKFNLDSDVDPVFITNIHKENKKALVLPYKRREE